MLLPATSTAPRRCSRCWTVVGPTGAVDVEVLARDDERLDAVLAELRRVLGTAAAPAFGGAARLPDDLALADVRLRHGAVLGLGRPVADALVRPGPRALHLRVVGGADAGRTIALSTGTHVLGRGQGADVRLDDPTVSRRHVAVSVSGGTVVVTDLGSSNGTTLDDRQVRDVSPWTPGTRLRLGATTLQLAGADEVPAAIAGSSGGRAVLRPAPPVPEVRTPLEIPFPQPPAQLPARRPPWMAVALPAVGGMALAVALRTPAFLFFTVLSPLAAIASWWSDRRSGRRAHRRDLADFARLTAEAENRLGEAVRDEVGAMHRRHPDLAALVSAAHRRTSLLWRRAPGDADALTIRVGTGPGATGVVRCAPDGSRSAAPGDALPVPVDLRAGGLAVVGPRARALGVLRSAIGQLATLHPPDAVDLVLVTSATRLGDWRWTRWLPHLRTLPVLVPEDPATGSGDGVAGFLHSLVERRRAVARSGAGRPWPGPWSAVVVDGPLPGPVAAVLAAAGDVGVTLLVHGATPAQVPTSVPAVVTVTGELGTTGRLQVAGLPAVAGIALDELPIDVAAGLSRAVAGLAPPAGRSALPSDVRLLDLAARSSPAVPGAPAEWTRDRGSLTAPVGAGAEGGEEVDLCRQGPHALVAGTTGSGKSELLQTLVAGLALRHPPDRCSFLLVDYKGGAAFAEAAALPHTVGLLTDLDEATTTRALRSLTAELTRREALLAAHGCGDIAQLPDDVPLARLVIVVDEFATLAEELPAFVPGLVGIAQRGRSLGIHLVLATQRPAGVVSADIRANCTLRICLRTTDEADSRDVLGTPDAAHLPLDRPGRAFLRTGTGAPRLVQVARVSQPPPRSHGAPVVGPWRWPAPSIGPAPASGARSDLADLVRDIDARAGELPTARPHRPWRAPLPPTLTLREAEALTGAATRPAGHLLLGVVDRPDRQDQRPLVLDLAAGGGWLAVGGPRSGRTTLLHSVLSQSVAESVGLLHVHVVDGSGGGLATVASALWCVGTAIAGHDPLRSVRLVQRLGEEVARRRSAGSLAEPPILLLVDGLESLCAVLDDADPAGGSAELVRLVRDGGAVGLTCVLTADRVVPGGRLAGMAQHRLVLPLGDRADYAVAGIPLTSVPATRPAGRAVVGDDAVECQLVLPLPIEGPGAAAERSAGRYPAPLRIAELAADPLVDGGLDGEARLSLRVAVGPGGDEGEVLHVELLRTGGLLVVGPPGSGRSSTLDAIVGDLAAASVPVLRLRGPRAGVAGTAGADEGPLADPAATAQWLAEHSGAPAVVCVDDLGPAGTAPALAALPLLGSAAGVVLLAAATAAELSTWFSGPVAALRRTRSGLLLRPGPGDPEVLGIRSPRTPVPVRPGSGWLVRSGAPLRVQVARQRGRPPAVQSSSSTGPISCVAYQASS